MMQSLFRTGALAWAAVFLSLALARAQEKGPPPAEGEKGGARAEGDRPGGPPREGRFERDRPPPREFDGKGPRPEGPPPGGRGPDGPPAERGFEGPRPFGPPGSGGPRGSGGPGMPGGPGGMHGHHPPNFEHLKEHDPEMYELLKSDHDFERQAFDLSQRFRNAPADQKAAVRTQVAEIVTKHFETRQQRRKLELKRLEEELKRLNESMQAREEARPRIIEQRLNQLLGEEGDLGF